MGFARWCYAAYDYWWRRLGGLKDSEVGFCGKGKF